MIDVEIGLAAKSLGQFGEGSRNAAGLNFHWTNLSEAVWSVQTISGEPVCMGLAFCGRALSICFWYGYFCSFDLLTNRKETCT